jgi:ABC-type proline/glycine betaine transport system permease subunit
MTAVAQAGLDPSRGLGEFGPDGAPDPVSGAPVRPATSIAERLRNRWRGLVVRPIVLAAVLVVLWLVVRSKQLDSIEARSLNRQEIHDELVQHIKLSLTATLITVAIAVPLGILLTRRSARWVKPLGLGLGNLGQAVPSIGLIVLLALWVGTGFGVACFALVVYAALPVLRNTIVGVEGVDPSLIEAARGMGMSQLAVLARIEVPLAVPVIIAGVRTALVLTFASATLATFIGAGGLGAGIIAGIGLNRPILSVTYGIITAALALFADWVGLVIEELLRPRGI